MRDLLRREMQARAEPRHVRAWEIRPCVIDLLINVFRDRCGIAARAVVRERRPDVADVDLARVQRMTVLAKTAVLRAFFEPAALDAVARAVMRKLLADLPVAHELPRCRVPDRLPRELHHFCRLLLRKLLVADL